MFQSLVEGREVPWSLLVKDVPKDKHQDLDFIIEQLDWEKNVDTHFKEHNYLEPIVDAAQQRRRAIPTAGSSTARSTASNSSAPRS